MRDKEAGSNIYLDIARLISQIEEILNGECVHMDPQKNQNENLNIPRKGIFFARNGTCNGRQAEKKGSGER